MSAPETSTRLKTTDHPFRGTRRPLAGAVVAFGLLLAACSGPLGKVPAATTLPASPLSTTNAADSPAAEPGLSLLRAALERYAAGYEFVSEARVGDELAIRVEGRRIGDAGRQTITSGDGTVEYLTVDGTQWARTPGEAWEIVAEGVWPANPLDQLSNPLAVTARDATATRTELEATYPADVFGLAGGDLLIRLVIQDLDLVSASYEAGDGERRAVVETTFGPPADDAPITAPMP